MTRLNDERPRIPSVVMMMPRHQRSELGVRFRNRDSRSHQGIDAAFHRMADAVSEVVLQVTGVEIRDDGARLLGLSAAGECDGLEH